MTPNLLADHIVRMSETLNVSDALRARFIHDTLSVLGPNVNQQVKNLTASLAMKGYPPKDALELAIATVLTKFIAAHSSPGLSGLGATGGTGTGTTYTEGTGAKGGTGMTAGQTAGLVTDIIGAAAQAAGGIVSTVSAYQDADLQRSLARQQARSASAQADWDRQMAEARTQAQRDEIAHQQRLSQLRAEAELALSSGGAGTLSTGVDGGSNTLLYVLGAAAVAALGFGAYSMVKR